MNIAEVARIWQQNGVSVIPILANKTKRPSVQWREYQARIPNDGELSEWWGNGHPYGIALICGHVSGNLEMTEIEGRAYTAGVVNQLITDQCVALGVIPAWQRVLNGYTQRSPSGGLHLLYRISDLPVPGNEKIARNAEGLVLAETRGEGGYVIGAPSPGTCHPAGKPWEHRSGRYGDIPLITWAERCLIHAAIRAVLDETPALPGPPPAPPRPLAATLVEAGAGVRPGDDFEARTSWAEILEPFGWQVESHTGNETHWTRPGKDRREGSSATTGYAGDRDRLYVFSTSTNFPTEEPITKFRAYSILNFGGDDSAAARSLVLQGFGSRPQVIVPDDFHIPLEPEEDFTLDDVGNARRLHKRVKGRFIFVYEEKIFYRWDGTCWAPDKSGELVREMVKLTDDMLDEAKRAGDQTLYRFATKSRSTGRLNAACEMLAKIMPGNTKSITEFNPYRHMLNLGNGVLDLENEQLLPHDPDMLMTRTFGASFNPHAECPQFEAFMEAAIPNLEMRDYVQRALGYSLLGDVDQRAMFLIYGPSGTGKSTLMETMRALFGEYGITAAAGAFRERRDNSPTNDLHNLRGKRFVTTSETAETTNFNEDLLKRLTGQDSITSRELYERNQEWLPECVIWLATNHPPKFTSDDDAIWRRAKLIPFTTQFLGEGQIVGMARNFLIPEADGILNWLLLGLRDYIVNGLGEPDEVLECAQEQRLQSDSVARFIDDKVADEILIPGDNRRIRSSELFAMYQEWARNVGERAVGNRRFHNRLQGFAHLEMVRINGLSFWEGIGRANGASILGSWGLHGPQ